MFRKLVSLGINEGTSASNIRRIRIVNIFILCAAVYNYARCIILFSVDQYLLGLALLGTALSLTGFLYLNYKGYVRLVRHVFWILVIIVISFFTFHAYWGLEIPIWLLYIVSLAATFGTFGWKDRIVRWVYSAVCIVGTVAGATFQGTGTANIELSDNQMMLTSLSIAVLGMGLLMFALVSIINDATRAERNLTLTNRELDKARSESDALLHNILPHEIAARLKQNDRATIADYFDSASVMFADLVGFTQMASQIEPKKLVELLNHIFTKFDMICQKHNIEKIKTIGDAYMAAGGIPQAREDHVLLTVRAAIEMRESLREINKELGTTLRMRIGISCGPVVAGVIGESKYIYDLWGDTVNVASRMESTGQEDIIQVTKSVADQLSSEYTVVSAGSKQVKGKGEMETFFVDV